ncbi:MAG: helix-turn-helix transcriptional regulator [Lachnospiraceae bacterium]|jgi:DNA-binding CsgD family transcriptional regulator
MRKKWQDFWKIIKSMKDQSMGMQQKLIGYWCVLILTLFSVALLLLSILGMIPGMDAKVGEMLEIQQKNTVASIIKQTDAMTARSIALSEEITKKLDEILATRGMAFADLNDNPELIRDLEISLYSSLKATLDVRYCSGVFVVLDATVNTEAENADSSRMGMYLRLSDLKAVNTYNQHMVYFRGNADVARTERMQLHNRWNLEFDITALEGYSQIMEFQGNRLVESCLWTDRLELKNTWEDVQLLHVPVLDSTGKVRGSCGMEMSDLYFRLSYPMVEGPYGNMVTVLAPMDAKGRILLDKAMLGNAEKTYLSSRGIMTVEEKKNYNIYSTDSGKYLGKHEILGMKCADGMPVVAVTLISEASYRNLVAENRKIWIMGTLIFLLVLVILSFVLSRRFVKPILQNLRDLQEDTKKQDEGSISMPPDIAQMFKDFASRVESLTPAERTLLQYYIDGYTIQEIASLLCISIGTARKHNTNMNRKLGITSKEELMLYIDLFRKSNQLERLTYRRTK